MAVAPLRLAAVALALTAAVGTSSAGATEPRLERPSRFVGFEFAATPPAPVGTRCPGAGSCWNNAVEPQIRADDDGTFYAATENMLLEGTIAAKSTNGGRHYETIPSPNVASSAEDKTFAPGGGDVDIAIAPVRNAAGFYNVYVASLTLAQITVSTSTDGGATWTINLTSAVVPGDDREWIAADGANTVCISYHDLVTFNINVDCSFDAGKTFTQHALPGAIDLSHLFLLQNNQLGNLAIDRASHLIYQPIVGISGLGEILCGFLFVCKYHAVFMAVSADGGKTFTDYPVYTGPSDRSYNHMFPHVSVDRAGNVYLLFSDDRAVFYAVSTDHGQSWSAPRQISSAPANTAIFPWATAGDSGKLDVVYYGTSYADGSTPPDRFPASAAWHVYFAQNLDATNPDSTFRQVEVTPVIHYGGVCEQGVGCTGNRDLFDDFGVAASPTTGRASIAYTTDQYVPFPGCTPERSNTILCDHTSIVTQTRGVGIFDRRR